MTGSGRIERAIGDERVHGVGFDQIHGGERRVTLRPRPRFVQVEPADERARYVVRGHSAIERLVDVGRVRGHDQTAPGR